MSQGFLALVSLWGAHSWFCGSAALCYPVWQWAEGPWKGSIPFAEAGGSPLFHHLL